VRGVGSGSGSNAARRKEESLTISVAGEVMQAELKWTFGRGPVRIEMFPVVTNWKSPGEILKPGRVFVNAKLAAAGFKIVEVGCALVSQFWADVAQR